MNSTQNPASAALVCAKYICLPSNTKINCESVINWDLDIESHEKKKTKFTWTISLPKYELFFTLLLFSDCWASSSIRTAALSMSTMSAIATEWTTMISLWVCSSTESHVAEKTTKLQPHELSNTSFESYELRQIILRSVSVWVFERDEKEGEGEGDASAQCEEFVYRMKKHMDGMISRRKINGNINQQ